MVTRSSTKRLFVNCRSRAGGGIAEGAGPSTNEYILAIFVSAVVVVAVAGFILKQKFVGMPVCCVVRSLVSHNKAAVVE